MTNIEPNLTRPRRKPGENRALLLASAQQHFATYGYFAASTGAIASSAGVPQPHVYANFATKFELFEACAQHVIHNICVLPTAMRQLKGSDQVHVAQVSDEQCMFIYQLFACARVAEFIELVAWSQKTLYTSMSAADVEALLVRGYLSLVNSNTKPLD